MRVALLATTLLALAACSKRSDAPAASSGAPTSLAASAPRPEGAPPAPVLDFVAGFDGCALGHRGVLLDLGDPTMRARMSAPLRLAVPDVEVREREGATWAAVHERSLEIGFFSPAELRGESGIVVEARVRGGTARSAAVYLNGKPVGVLPLKRGETTVVSARAAAGVVARGTNELLVRFSGGSRATRDELAEIDWIRVGPQDGDAPYAAPTRGDALTSVSIGGVARRGISLRAPGFARCAGHVPSGAVLEGYLGVTGGEAEAEVRVLVDRAEPRVVGRFRLGGGEEAPAWRPLSLPLGDVDTLAGVELVAVASSKGARVVFAEPRVVAPAPSAAAEVKSGRGVVLVVLGSTSRGMLSLYGGSVATPELSALAGRGLVFEGHRASSGLASGAMASMLTGLPPREHGVGDPDAALAPGVVTVAEAARQAGVVTALFTANPTTSPAFGFARGWETLTARAPSDGETATALFDDVGRWLDAHKGDRFLVVVHARGGHPPWDATADDLKDLAPAGYAGSVEPKHAAEVLAKARRAGAARFFTDADRERAFALYARAVGDHDAALGRLLAQLRAVGREGDTTVVVTSDVGVDAAAHVPFLEDESLDEGSLALPLVVLAPGGGPGRVRAATSSVDLARTMLEALGLPPPPRMRGEDLRRGPRAAAERPALASSSSRFSARWGGFVLTGARDRELRLCNLSLEPECVSDVRATHPLAADVLHTLVFDELASGKHPASSSPRIAPDPPTAAALRLWGR